MVRVIIVDDELPALKMAQSVLRAFDEVQINGGICRLIWSPDYWDCAEYMDLYKQYKSGSLSMKNLKRTIEIYAKIIAINLLLNNREAAILHYKKIKEIFVEEEGIPIEIDVDALISNPYLAF